MKVAIFIYAQIMSFETAGCVWSWISILKRV